MHGVVFLEAHRNIAGLHTIKHAQDQNDEKFMTMQ